MSEVVGNEEPVWLTGADGNRLAATVTGDPAGPPVILLHGGGQTRFSWKHVMPTLAERGFHAIAFDARGHGQSDWVDSGAYRLTDYAGDLQAISRRVGRSVSLIGASMGGMTALTALDPDRSPVDTHALVLVDIVPITNAKGVDRIRAFMLDYTDGFANSDEAAAAVARWRGTSIDEDQWRRISRGLRHSPDGRVHWHWDPRILWSQDEVDAADHTKELVRITSQLALPVLLHRGALSDVVGEEEEAQFKALVPHSLTATVPEMGHSASSRALISHSPLLEFLRDHGCDLTQDTEQ